MTEALAPYPAPAAREAELDAIAESLGGDRGKKLDVEIRTYGESVEGRALRAIRVRSQDAGQDSEPADKKPAVMVCANIHGVEWIANRVAHGFLDALTTESGEKLLARAQVWVLPCLNPDGYARTFAQEGKARVRDLRKNANKVDLNRNFPLPFSAQPSRWPGSGSYVVDDATYRGPAPKSEPEVSFLCRLLEEVKPWASCNLHSFMGTMIPPRVPDLSEHKVYRELFLAFAAAQKRRYRVVGSHRFDVFTGEQEDHQHHVQQTWAVCVESFPIAASLRQHLHAPSAFWRFNPRDPKRWVENDVPGLYGFLNAALDRPRPGSGRLAEGAITPRTSWRPGDES